MHAKNDSLYFFATKVNLYCIVIFCTFRLYFFCLSWLFLYVVLKYQLFNKNEYISFPDLFSSGWLILMGTFRCVGEPLFFFVIFVNICIASHCAHYTMGEKRVENECIYFCRSIFADKSPALITHSMPTNRVKTIDEKIVNRFSKFTLHYCWGVRGNWIFADPAKICGHLLNEHMWTWYVCVCLSSLYSVTLHEINLVKFARPLNGIDMSWLLFIIQNFFLIFQKHIAKHFL